MIQFRAENLTGLHSAASFSHHGARPAHKGVNMLLIEDISVPMDIARARPVSIAPSEPAPIAYATAMTVPERASAGIAPPIALIPIKIASREAPMIMPVLKSPKTRPTTGATTIGRAIASHPVVLSR